ncbi:G5 domain-containing protein [Streptococcus uberis]|uniref:G5 domain-containing protein n=1 Tax=Streptococcus uberis TaxID=1349 RepID=UPI0027DDD2E0|nr:G5 domain-containing protein [Streptococcus uberis]MCK1239065.1 G5 domain-containing protein [Streptococcus uberis]
MKIEIKNNMRNNIKKNHRQPRYALRKMSVGFTSCVIGWCIFSSSTTVHASVLPDTSISTSTTSINNTTQTSPITENVVDTSTITKPIDSNKLIESTATTIETTSTVETITVALENNTAVEPTNTTVENTTAVKPSTATLETTTAIEPITTSVETISSTDGIATNSTSTSTSQLQPKMLMMISPMSVSPTAPSIYISNMTELLNAINNYSDVNIFIKGTTYLIDKAISIASGKNISFNVDPSSTEPVIFLRDVSKGYLSRSLVTVEQGASITFNSDPGQMIIDGGSTDNPSSGIVSETGLLLTNKGETIINGAEFRNQNLFYGSYIAPIYTSGPGSKLVINSGSIHDNKITANSERIIYSSTAILAENESQVFFNGGEIYNNTIDKSLINSDSVGVINISDGSYFEMNGGQIHHNSARSGVTIGDSRFYAYYIKPETWQTEGTIKNNPTGLLTIDQIFVPGKRMPKIAKAVINNGTINNNMAYANGGGLNVWSASEVTINGGKIENNETNGYGGGISIIDNYLNYLGGYTRKIANVKRSEWEQYLGAKLTINNATINGNKSTDGRGYGGGMFIASDLVTINKADISNNMAVNGAGIAMTDKAYTLKLKNVSTDQSIGNSSFSNSSDSNLYIYEKDGLVFTPINPGTGTSNSNYDLTANWATNNILDPAYRMLGGGLINYIDKLGNTVNADPKYSNSVTPTNPAHYIDPIDGYATKSSLDYGKTLASITMNGNYSVYYYRALNRYYPSYSSGSNFFNGGTLIIGTPDNIKNEIDVNATLNFKTIYDSFLAQDPNNILKLTVNYETPMGNVILEEHDIPSLEGLVQIIGNLSETNDLSKLKFQFSGINTDETITLTADNFIKSETISSTERVWNSDTFMFDEKTYYTTLNHFRILLDTVIKSVETITSLPEKIIYDSTKPIGTEIVEPGVDGLTQTNSTILKINGIESDVIMTSQNVIKEPIAQIRIIGTGVVGQNVDVTFEVIPIPTQPAIIEDETIPLGEEVIVETGSEGQIKVTTTTPTLNGIPNGEPIVTREIVTQAKAKVIKRGTGISSSNIDTIKARITKAISDKKHEVNANETIILPNTGFKHNHKQTYGLLSILLSLILFVFKSKRRTK